MRELVSEIRRRAASGLPTAYCRLVETRGSTPQKAGAAMLVFPGGAQMGTLGGGCVEAEVKRQALSTLEQGPARVVRFSLDSDYGWDDGLICGGRMTALIDPVRSADDAEYFATLESLLARNQSCLEAITYDAEKSGLPVPAQFLFDGSGACVAARVPGTARAVPPAQVLDVLAQRTSTAPATAAQGIACLPTRGRCRLLIVGGGHVGQAVAAWADSLDFDVWIVDDREDYITEARFPSATRRIAGPIGATLAELAVDENTYCLIVTRGHNHDEEALYHLADRGARYVGMIGSKRKIRLIFDDLLDRGVPEAALAKVFAPVGIDIGSQTVAEIAVSILAELVAHRNRQGFVPGRPAGALVEDA